MSDKHKNRRVNARLKKAHLRKVADEFRHGADIPLGAVLADPSQQVPNCSYMPPPLFYVDKKFVCIDCGQNEVWTAQQQKWYYEVAKGSLYATAVRCGDCRRKLAERHDGHGDPNPIKHDGSLLKRIRSHIEPQLFEAGFEFDGKDYARRSRNAWIDYSRTDRLFRIIYDRYEARLIAETMDEKAECSVVANMELSGPGRSALVLVDRVDKFTAAVQQYLQTLPIAAKLPTETTPDKTAEPSGEL